MSVINLICISIQIEVKSNRQKQRHAIASHDLSVMKMYCLRCHYILFCYYLFNRLICRLNTTKLNTRRSVFCCVVLSSDSLIWIICRTTRRPLCIINYYIDKNIL